MRSSLPLDASHTRVLSSRLEEASSVPRDKLASRREYDTNTSAIKGSLGLHTGALLRVRSARHSLARAAW